MNLPTNTADDCAFALKFYAKNASLTTMTNGGGHFPCTGVIVIYELPD